MLTFVKFVDQRIKCTTRHASTRGKGWDCVAVTLIMVVVSKNNIYIKKKVNFNSFLFRPRRGAACVVVTNYLATLFQSPSPRRRSVNHSQERKSSADSHRMLQLVLSADGVSLGSCGPRVTSAEDTG
jgi:hypothetical protein